MEKGGHSFSPIIDEHLQACRLPSSAEVAGKGDAVTGIDRADTANGPVNAQMLRYPFMVCNCIACRRRLSMPGGEGNETGYQHC
jgi:hypothetical protein